MRKKLPEVEDPRGAKDTNYFRGDWTQPHEAVSFERRGKIADWPCGLSQQVRIRPRESVVEKLV